MYLIIVCPFGICDGLCLVGGERRVSSGRSERHCDVDDDHEDDTRDKCGTDHIQALGGQVNGFVAVNVMDYNCPDPEYCGQDYDRTRVAEFRPKARSLVVVVDGRALGEPAGQPEAARYGARRRPRHEHCLWFGGRQSHETSLQWCVVCCIESRFSCEQLFG